MDFIFSLITAFGGGVVGAYVGAVPAFIMTGVFALIGALDLACGGTGLAQSIAFGAFLSPAVSFGGGVAAAAYAGKKGALASGADVTTPLASLGKFDVLVVGGAFGIVGWLCQYVIGFLPAVIGTDAPGFGVIVVGVLSRLIFGKTGLLGKYTGSGKRGYISKGGAFITNLVLGVGLGILVGGLAAGFIVAGNTTALNNLPVIMFGFAAITLTFAVAGHPTPAVHHIVLPAGLGAQAFAMLGGSPILALVGAVIFGTLGAVLGDFFGSTFNSYADAHIDPPACTIVTLTICASVLKFVFGMVG